MSNAHVARRGSRALAATAVTAGAAGLVAVLAVVVAVQRDGRPSTVQPTAAPPSVSSVGPTPSVTTEATSAVGSAVAAPPPSVAESSPTAEGAVQAAAGEDADAAGSDAAGSGDGGSGDGGSGAGAGGDTDGAGDTGGGPAAPVSGAGPARVAPGGFPDSDSTGPTSANLRSYGGNLRADEPGATYDGYEFGCVDVYADGVTIRNSVIRCDRDTYPVYNRASDLTLIDVEIDGQGKASNCVAHSEYTLVRAELYGCKDGARANGDVLIEDSYIHSLVRVPDGHHDVIQSTKGSNITLRGNTLIAETNGENMNAAYMAGSAQGPLDRVYVIGNYLVGGNFTLQIDPGISEGIYADNVFGRGARYGPVRSVPDSIEWRNNTWEDTGAPVS